MDMASTPRLAPRSSVMLMAAVWRDDQAAASQHRVVNLSAAGIALAGGADLREGMTVAVSIGMIEHVGAQVVWVRAGQAGLHFHVPIDLAAARKRRAGGALPAPRAGWIDSLRDAYNR